MQRLEGQMAIANASRRHEPTPTRFVVATGVVGHKQKRGNKTAACE